MAAQTAIVDGANVAYMEKSASGQPKVSNLLAVRRALLEKGYETVIIIADASLKYKVDDPQQLESLFNSQIIRQAPAGTDADYFVLETAAESGADVISNDEFEPYRSRHPWIPERRVPLMIIQGQVELYEPATRRPSR